MNAWSRGRGRAGIHPVEQSKVHRLRMVDDDVTNAAEAFLLDLQPLAIPGPHHVGVRGEAPRSHCQDEQIDEGECHHGDDCGRRVDVDQACQDHGRNEGRDERLDEGEENFKDQDFDQIDARDQRARVALDVEAVTLREDIRRCTSSAARGPACR